MKHFVDYITSKRVEATKKGQKHLQNLNKLMINASYGRSGLNLKEQSISNFVE